MTELTNKEKALHMAAQCWCDHETSHKEMDTLLAGAFAKRIEDLLDTIAARDKRIAELEHKLQGKIRSDKLTEALKDKPKLI